VDSIRALLPELQALVPADIKISVMSDRTTTLRKSIEHFKFTFAISVLLVTLVVFLFLRRRIPTIAAMLTVPLSLAGTVVAMWFVGYTLDNVSLLALTIAVGFVVDDAIVVIENCYRNMEAGLSPLKAAFAGAQQIGFTVISMSLSLIAAFIPLLFTGGMIGKVLQEFAWTLTFAIAISAVISLTLTPMIIGRFTKRMPRSGETWMDRRIEPVFEWLVRHYTRTLDKALEHRWLMTTTTILVLALSVVTFLQIPGTMVPQGDADLIIGGVSAAPDISFTRMSTLQQKVTKVLLADPDVKGVGASVGNVGRHGGGNKGRFYVTLKPDKKSTATEFIGRMRKKMRHLKGARIFMFPAREIGGRGHSTSSYYQVTFWGPSLQELTKWVPQIAEKVKGVKGITDVDLDHQEGGPDARVIVDRRNAARLGVSMRAVNAALNSAFAQRQISTIYDDRAQHHVVFEVDPKLQRDMSGFSQISVTANNGRQIPLEAIAKMEVSSTPLAVNHEGQFPSITLSFNLKDGAILQPALDGMMDVVAHMHLPESIHVRLAGETEELRKKQTADWLLLVAALLAVYLVLGILYEDLVHPFTILSTLPSAGFGALFTLYLFNLEFSIIALIGIILLIGIVKKNGIMMVDFALEIERTRGVTGREAIREACIVRFRPILMTSLAAMFCALPLALATGPGSELRIPLGLTVIGGLMVSQLLTIYTTPVIYLWLDKLRRRKHKAIQPVTVSAE
jgi:multidrug efflux pump